MHRALARIAQGTAIVVLALVAAPAGANAAPSCAEGPETVGDTIVGTPCGDAIRPGRGITTVLGEGGNDTIFGGRGNDRLFGGPGDDDLFGGIGDDQLRGGEGDDLLSGGFGADSALDGEAGDDVVRGDATIDSIQNTGGGIDTLSYATGVTPGFFDRSAPPYSFPDFSIFDGFPQGVDGRGAYVNLGTGRGDNGRAPHGGGFDEDVAGAEFEVVIGTAFADYLVGTSAPQTFYGGGGADVVIGGGGGDVIHGGADGDYCDPGSDGTAQECEFGGADTEVEPRDPGAIAVGTMAPGAAAPPAVYLTGSDEDDVVVASYADSPRAVTFVLEPGSDGGFDPSPAAAGGCEPPAAGKVVCPLGAPPDSVTMAGLDGDDDLIASGFPETTSVVLLGNGGGDLIEGGGTEDALVDGDGGDLVRAFGGDDAVPNNQGTDELEAGNGEDLFISDSVCESDRLDGGPDRDNANWANFDAAISIEMPTGAAGLLGPDGRPDCPGGDLTSLQGIEDVEGTSFGDTMIGDSGPNQLLGRLGPDTYDAGDGEDSILANSGTPIDDPDQSIDCGADFDTAQVDRPENGPDPAPIGCEAVFERDPNSFRPPQTPPDPTPPTTVEQPTPPPSPPLSRDRVPPRTRLLGRPGRTVLSVTPRRLVGFSFASDEAGATFRCRLDRGRFRPCRSPRSYRVAAGRHVFAVFAIDRAGNRDRSAVRIAFRVRRR